jgi:hypothetical protein
MSPRDSEVAIAAATQRKLPKSPGPFCAHEGNAHGPQIFVVFVRTPVFSRTIFVRTSPIFVRTATGCG